MIDPAYIVSGIVGILTVAGSVAAVRYQGRSSREVAEVSADVEQRKVDQATFDRNVAHVEKEIARLTHQVDQLSGIVSVSFSYIGDLRTAWPPDRLDARPAVPAELRNRVPLWLVGERTDNESDV